LSSVGRPATEKIAGKPLRGLAFSKLLMALTVVVTANTAAQLAT
jgi:hypothetical protein